MIEIYLSNTKDEFLFALCIAVSRKFEADILINLVLLFK